MGFKNIWSRNWALTACCVVSLLRSNYPIEPIPTSHIMQLATEEIIYNYPRHRSASVKCHVRVVWGPKNILYDTDDHQHFTALRKSPIKPLGKSPHRRE